jgi:hypothetical protein
MMRRPRRLVNSVIRKESHMRRFLFSGFAFLLLATLTCFSQQTEIKQFAVVTGYSYLATPSLNLAQRGFNGDFAQNVRPWLSLGFDFSTFSGGSTLLPTYLNSATQMKLVQAVQSGFPASALARGIPYTSSTYTYQAGPQFNYRRLRKVTLFIRPALGLLHAKVQTTPYPVAATLVKGLMKGKLAAADNAIFWGFGGGATWEIHPNFGLRVAADLARFNFFPDMLNGSRNTVRLTVATKFGFGRNIVERY